MHPNTSFGFRLSQYEKIAQSKDIIKRYIFETLPGFNILSVPGDGLCSLHAFSEGMFTVHGTRYSISENKTRLKDQLKENKDYYSKFSVATVDVIEELEHILSNPLLNYDSDTTDLFLKRLAMHSKLTLLSFNQMKRDVGLSVSP